jgi:hypothetical protein|tara:strand:+ start:535 stop:957 length:423 start_codon:yes stop_codon:yes gene_type:complete
MKPKKILGISFILLGVIISVSNLSITGAVIGSSLSNYFSFLAIAFLLVGVLLMMASRDRNYAQEILDRGVYENRTRKLKKIARKMGYELEGGHKEGTRVYNDETVLTVIPHGKEVHGTGTQKSILEALATGISSFRRKTS